MIHFNVDFKESKYGYKMSRETYLPKQPESAHYYFPGEMLNRFISDCYENYDLNIKYFNTLNKVDFNNELNAFLLKYKEFVEIKDMNETKNKTGYYIMVLDEYKQLYIGTTEDDIYKRLRKHMGGNQRFERLIWGRVNTSKLSINSFRPLDTTRIFVYYTKKSFSRENEFISFFSDDFVLNRVEGGKMPNGFMDIFSHGKYREL